MRANADAVDRIGRARWPGILVVGVLVCMVVTAGFATVRGALAAGTRLAGSTTEHLAADLARELGPGARSSVDEGGLRVGTTERGAVHVGVSFSLLAVPADVRVTSARLQFRRLSSAPVARSYSVFELVGDLTTQAAAAPRPAGQQALTAVVLDPSDGEDWVEFEVTADVTAAIALGATAVGFTIVDMAAGVGAAQVVVLARAGVRRRPPAGPHLRHLTTSAVTTDPWRARCAPGGPTGASGGTDRRP